MTEQTVSVDQTQGALRASIGEHDSADQPARAVAEFMADRSISVPNIFEKLAVGGGRGHSHIAKAAVVVAATVQDEKYAQHVADRLAGLSDKAALRYVLEDWPFDSTGQEMLAHALGTRVADLHGALRVWNLVSNADRWEQILAPYGAHACKAERKDTATTEFRHFLGKARDAARGGRDAWDVQSTGEKVAVALVLNKPAWLKAMDYSMVEAIERAGSTWVALMPAVVRELRDAGDL